MINNIDDDPQISIVIVNYNTPDLTVDCLKSIDKFPPKQNFEVVLVDNGSEKESVNALENLSLKNFKVKMIFNGNNLGFAKANNQGIKQAKGEYVLLLNSDTEVKPRSIDMLLEFAKTEGSVGAVGSKLLNSDGSVQASAFRFPTIGRAIKQYWLGKKNLLDKYIPSDNQPTDVEVLVMAALLITPQTLKKVGLLDERYFMFFEDFDYCRRIKQAGLKVFYLPESEVIHHHGASGKKITDQANQWRRLVPSSKIYHGILGHCIYNFILWSSQKMLQLSK
ncbi:MAG: glycosyltransferase family 2 protein [Patescibacteria group bacterium]